MRFTLRLLTLALSWVGAVGCGGSDTVGASAGAASSGSGATSTSGGAGGGAGTAATTFAAVPGVTDIEVDDAFVYFLANHVPYRAAKDGSAPTPLASVASGGNRFALDGQTLYCEAVGSIAELSTSGGAPTPLTPENDLADIAARGGDVVWTSGAGLVLGIASGGSPVTIAANQDDPQDIAVDDANVYWLDMGTTGGTASINVAPRAGGAATQLFSGPAAPHYLALRGGYLYFTDGPASRIARVPVGGGSVDTVVASNAPTFMAVDDANVYFIEQTMDAPAVKRAPITGGPATVIAPYDGSFRSAIAVDANSVYFATETSIMKAPK